MKRATVRLYRSGPTLYLKVDDDRPDQVNVSIVGERGGQRRAIVVKLADLRAALDEVSS